MLIYLDKYFKLSKSENQRVFQVDVACQREWWVSRLISNQVTYCFPQVFSIFFHSKIYYRLTRSQKLGQGASKVYLFILVESIIIIIIGCKLYSSIVKTSCNLIWAFKNSARSLCYFHDLSDVRICTKNMMFAGKLIFRSSVAIQDWVLR